MESKIKETILAEIRNSANHYEKGSMKYSILSGLYEKIKGMNDDDDIVNTVWANKDIPLRMFTEPELNRMPGLTKLLIGEPRTGNVDYEKMFGKDWIDNYENIPYNQIAVVAAKTGKDPKQISSDMGKLVTEKRRKDIAHEGVLGTVMPFVTPRIQEAIERGEDPSVADVGIDLGETAIQAFPWGRASMLAVNNPIVRRLAGGAISNATAPLLAEAADAAAYDSTNARGNFDPTDVAAGAGVNVLGANLLKGVLGRGANVVGAKDAGQKLINLGEGETLTQSLTKDLKDISKLEARNEALMKRNVKGEALSTHTAGSNQQRIDAMNYEKNRDALENRKQILEEIDYRYNSNKARDNVYGKGNHTTLPDNLRGFENDWQPDEFGALTDEQLKSMMNDPVLQKYINVDMNVWPTEARFMKEEAVKNLITNKLGGWMDEQGKAWTRIPMVGPMIQRNREERAKEEAEEEKLREIYEKYKYDMFGGI